MLAFAPSALAGPPVHPLLPDPVNGFPLNHACGTAVDSEGNIYVSSAGESKIEIFDPSGAHLTSISNANTPCGLAVDTRGDLFVSEQGTGDIVRYVPEEYPFPGSPTYGSPEPIDGSGNAKGIFVDTAPLLTNSKFLVGGDDSLYIAKGDHIDAYRNETQRLQVNGSGGSWELCFEGQCTGPLPSNASHGEVQASLESLTAIGGGNVSVTAANFQDTDHLVTFTHEMGLENVSPIEADGANLTGGGIGHEEADGGSIATIGAGELTEATGVAAYRYVAQPGMPVAREDRYVFAADAATDTVKVFSGPSLASLKLRRAIDGPKGGESFGFGEAGAYLAVDPGNLPEATGSPDPFAQKCENPIEEQACTAGHLLVYDDAHEVVDEFEADGEFLDHLTSAQFADAKPTALAVDRSGTASDGRIYVTVGAAGAKLLAFGPLAAPSRPLRSELSHVLPTTRAVATDSVGNVYVAAGSLVHVFDPEGGEIEVGPNGEGLEIAEPPVDDLAVDSACNVYVLVNKGVANPQKGKVQYYSPGACLPKDGTQYAGPVTVADGNSFESSPTQVYAIGINPANDHIFVGSTGDGQIIELESAAAGSEILNPCFGCAVSGLPHVGNYDVAAYGRNGNVYISKSGTGTIFVIDPGDLEDPDDDELIARITGVGSHRGGFGGSPGAIAVDQSNGHVFAFVYDRPAGEEFDASGAFLAEFGEFTNSKLAAQGIAIDNSGGPGDGNVYVAFDDPAPGTFDLTAFGPLAYGEPPLATTGIASGIGAGAATLNGTVKPLGFALTGCRFEYLLDSEYEENRKAQEENEEPDEPFAGAVSKACAESLEGIGSGAEPVAVHADLTGLDPDARYRFRLVAENKYGIDASANAGLFGPPQLKVQNAFPVLYDEATLRAEVDPSGLATKYHFEYVTQGHFEAQGFEGAEQTPVSELPPGDGYAAVKSPLTGLAEGSEYRFRILVESEAGTVEGPEQGLTTLERLKSPPCPNAEYRTGFSALLPDCRAYELVTPAETRGSIPQASRPGTAGDIFNNWLVAPRGEDAGESLAYFSETTLPGFEGSGVDDAYRARRGPGEHPASGWSNELLGPSFAEQGGERSQQHGISADQRYGFFNVSGQGALAPGRYVRTPVGLELIGRGSVAADPQAQGNFLSGSGEHVVFSSTKHLEPEAAPEGTVSVYDRAAGSADAEVVSVKPDGSSFGAGKDAHYVAATEDGSTVLFEAAGVLYLHKAGNTVEIAADPNTFAGVSADGRRVFYVDAILKIIAAQPAGLHVCEVEAGPCAGPGAHAAAEIAPNAVFVNVSSDGSRVFFFSEDVLTGAEENEAGEAARADEPNLYLWDGTATRFLAVLDQRDVEKGGFADFVDLRRWAGAVGAGVELGRGKSPTRSTPDGGIFVFQSHARLTPYDNQGATEIYRYDSAAASGETMLCVSCDPSGAPPGTGAQFLEFNTAAIAEYSTLVSNVTDDGSAVFFESSDRLLPEDANEVADVYEWKAKGSGGCERPGGCLGLISSGQGEEPSYLYGMSADGHDVFFETPEKLLGADITASPSLYDARVGGGIPSPPEALVCRGDACQGAGSTPPVLPAPASSGGGDGNVRAAPCPKGKRKVRRKGKTRCIGRRGKHHRHRHADRKRGGKR